MYTKKKRKKTTRYVENEMKLNKCMHVCMHVNIYTCIYLFNYKRFELIPGYLYIHISIYIYDMEEEKHALYAENEIK